MHLAVFPGDRTVFLQDDGRVMVQARGTLLEKGKHQDDTQFFRQGTEGFRRWAGDRLCQVKHTRIFRLAEIQAVMQFLQDDQFRSLPGSLTDIYL